MVEPTELEGTHVHVTAAGAHWQFGKTEVHGGWFGRVLSKVLDSKPSDPRSMVRMRSPSSCEKSNDSKLWIYPQSKSCWKRPDIPGDLLNEPQPTVPNTGSLHDDAIARTYAIRTQESSVRITR